MAPTPTSPDPAPAREGLPDGEPASAVRRAPFSDNPEVGARGLRTQQRILDAAIEVFGQGGYHNVGVAQVTAVAGCSRASFYQYFSGKEDVFRHLTGQVARQLTASTEALAPVTAGPGGWAAVRAWVGRHCDIHERYEPVFRAFEAAAESDEAVAPGAARTMRRNVARFRAKVEAAALPPRRLDPVLALLFACVTRTYETARTLRAAAPAAHARHRVEDALADVVHRSLFGLLPDVNVHPPAPDRPPTLGFGPLMREALERPGGAPGPTAAGRPTLDALERAGRQVFVARGYHRTRIDDIVEAAGVSHGAFYRYFRSKDHLARPLAVSAMRTVSAAMAEVPDAAGGTPDRAALRRWLRRYNATQATETAMIRVWVDAALTDEALAPDSAAALDWGRRAMARVLGPRGFGDVDTEAVVMVSLLSAYGARPGSPADADAAAHVIERGLLGR